MNFQGRNMLKPIKRKGPSPLKPRKLAKQVNTEDISEQIAQEKPEDQEVQATNKEVHTNATVLSKQIKIVSQLNAKQVDNFISDRNTIKAHGLQINIKFYDSFNSDFVDIVYYQAVALSSTLFWRLLHQNQV